MKTPDEHDYWRQTSTLYCVLNFEAWGGVGVRPYGDEHGLIQQVRYLSPMGEALVEIVRQGLPVLMDSFHGKPDRAFKLEEEIHAYLTREAKRLEDATPEAPAPEKSRRL